MSDVKNTAEYELYKKEFQDMNLEKLLKHYSKKYRNKKILIYGNGIYFDVIADNYDLKKYFNIVGVSDLRYDKHPVDFYKGFKAYSPLEIKSLDIDAVFITTAFTGNVVTFLQKHKLLKEHADIFAVSKNEHIAKPEGFSYKLEYLCKYLFETKDLFKVIKYFIFCSPREVSAKYHYYKTLQKIRSYPAERKIRVVFICEENSKWGYQSVYDELKQDSRFEILPIVCVPILTKNRTSWTQEENIEFFKNLNIEAIDGYNKDTETYIDLKTLEPDIVFYQQHWYSLTTMPPFETAKYALTGVVSYGFTSVDAEIWGMGTPREFCGTLWKMFAESEYHKSFYEKATKLKFKDILKVSGYPKLDYYKNPIAKEFELLWKDENTKEKHRIIWAPHHSIENFGFGMSNFKEQAVQFFEYAKAHPEYSFLVKPHPALKYKCSFDGFMTEEEYDKYMDDWNNLPNACVYSKGNYFDIFKTSDILVTDSSSFLGEYFVSGKPILFFQSPKRTPFNKFGLEIKKGFYNAKTLEDMDKILKKILIDKQDDLKPLRLEIAKKEIYLPENGIGKGIVDFIRKKIF